MLKSQIESLLFASTKPITSEWLVKFLVKQGVKVKKEQIDDILIELQAKYNQNESGINLIESNGQYQLVTGVQNSELIKALVKDEKTGELSQPSLETLTIIAYRGPITKPILEQIRGVNCSLILRNLLIRGLIQEEKQGNGIVYFVTPELLKYLGLVSVNDLPNYEKLHQVENLEEFLDKQKKEQAVEGEDKSN
ncbi:SMC-Scp complex subunit ScpB [Candidatus Falkowbacteria bacterium CG10_big_fil_rev_8_21_14_0_10_39_11]|uniref:SMC-Scp complex subunit ScpB n=1 Tax=Candidatus Falkowbacteria bacterium CG10_big_fil_rev_8_21_14_0_10_39_11 TaxID=1974565 RepID=A0A2H0V5F3_9BACT|nr:MAG: SMC-Scp complex subunit ScpB [Candidatus Falkowbacteria bacterium CG10_big_fil_rev_8_21_14_0_10_39_11]